MYDITSPKSVRLLIAIVVHALLFNAAFFYCLHVESSVFQRGERERTKEKLYPITVPRSHKEIFVSRSDYESYHGLGVIRGFNVLVVISLVITVAILKVREIYRESGMLNVDGDETKKG